MINLGSTNISGNTRITGAVGARAKLSEDLLLGLTYE